MLNDLTLEKAIQDALYKAFVQTFGDNPTSKTKEIATNFAKAGAPDIANAISTYVRSLEITLMPSPQSALVSPTGPVTGAINSPSNFFMLN